MSALQALGPMSAVPEDFHDLAHLVGAEYGQRLRKDLSFDCLRPLGPQQCAIHVPLGKLKTERMVPVDSFVCQLVQRLRFFRSLDPSQPDGRLLARRNHRAVLLVELRAALVNVRTAAGITARIVPHQFRHTFATEMLSRG